MKVMADSTKMAMLPTALDMVEILISRTYPQ
uniref:Uncharacterized protein n=1 Tax=Arundo donax TaxID=35708 RepID=A0A0A9FY68_ARUDO